MSDNSPNALLERATQATNRAADQGADAIHRSAAALRESSQHGLDRAQAAVDATSGYVRESPVKSLLMAAAAGAALMALLAMATRGRSHG